MRRIVTCIAAAVATLALAATARADIYDDNPATASRGGGDLWVFARAANGETLARHRDDTGAWSDWSSLGGQATSGPAAVGYGSSVLVFVRGLDGATYENAYRGGAWTGWTSLGGYATSAPAAAVRRGAEGYVDLTVKGGDNAIYFQTFVPGTGWAGWSSRGGNLTSAPALNSQSAGVVNIWSRGTDGAVKQMAWNGSAWSDWLNLEGGIFGAPAAVSRAENVVDLYVRGAGDATYQRYWTAGGGWSGWFLLDSAPIASAPAAGGDGPGHEWIFARRGDGLGFKEWTSSGGWTAWSDLGPVALPAPAAPAPLPQQTLDGELDLVAGLRCTPANGRLRVSITVHRRPGQAKARVQRIVFYTKGRHRSVRVDRKAPFATRIAVNRPAGKSGRVYARVYFRRSKHGKLHHKTVSRRFVVCR